VPRPRRDRDDRRAETYQAFAGRIEVALSATQFDEGVYTTDVLALPA